MAGSSPLADSQSIASRPFRVVRMSKKEPSSGIGCTSISSVRRLFDTHVASSRRSSLKRLDTEDIIDRSLPVSTSADFAPASRRRSRSSARDQSPTKNIGLIFSAVNANESFENRFSTSFKAPSVAPEQSAKAAIGKPSVKKIDSDHLESIFKISEKPIRFYTCKRLAIACWSNLISSHLKFVYVISDKISLSFDIIVPSNSR